MRNAARLALALFAALPLFAQNFTDAHVTPVRAAADLGAQIRAASGWIGYSVPAVAKFHSGECGFCSLADNRGRFYSSDSHTPDVARDAMVMYRVDGGSVERIRIYSTNCSVDGDGKNVTWIENVDPRASIRFLETLIDDERHALDAIAFHADDSATDVLDRVAHSTRSTELRGHALFWLGLERGVRGYEIVRAITTNPNEPSSLREKGIFAMMQSHQPRAVDDVLAIAKHDETSHVRGQALFWLSQAAGKKAAAGLRDAVDNDPDSSVKEKAVFGISQLPNDQSIPMLADLMRNHRSPSVRKKAAFWLGQKNDPRAFEAIEEFLKR